jgi:demethylmenaquinone methyltransferase/2-methoxy-6-polyprenyl-1,4-benzoquinol methylase
VSLDDRLATPLGKRAYVRALFATIADRYDFITVALSYGQDRRWKRRLIELASIRAGHRVLDLATGTGDIAFAASARGARVVGLDITYRMIELACAKRSLPAFPARPARPARPAFLVGDMLALPFPSSSFDIVTTGYGLRNLPDLTQGIGEIGRVLIRRYPGAEGVARLLEARGFSQVNVYPVLGGLMTIHHAIRT